MKLNRLINMGWLMNEAGGDGGNGGQGDSAPSGDPAANPPSGRPSLGDAVNQDPPPADPAPGTPPAIDPNATPPTDPPPPAEYALSFGESFSGDEAMRTMVQDLGKKHGLDATALSAFVNEFDVQLNEAKKQADAVIAQQWMEVDHAWGRESTDRQYRAVQMAGKVCQMAGIEQSALVDMGIADHPMAYRLFDAMARMLGERSIVAPKATGGNGTDEARRIMSDPSHQDYEAFHNVRNPRFTEVRNKYYDLMGR